MYDAESIETRRKTIIITKTGCSGKNKRSDFSDTTLTITVIDDTVRRWECSTAFAAGYILKCSQMGGGRRKPTRELECASVKMHDYN